MWQMIYSIYISLFLYFLFVLVLMLLSASVERFSVPRMWEYLSIHLWTVHLQEIYHVCQLQVNIKKIYIYIYYVVFFLTIQIVLRNIFPCFIRVFEVPYLVVLVYNIVNVDKKKYIVKQYFRTSSLKTKFSGVLEFWHNNFLCVKPDLFKVLTNTLLQWWGNFLLLCYISCNYI